MTPPNPELAYEILDQIDEASSRIINYIVPIQNCADFTANNEN